MDSSYNIRIFMDYLSDKSSINFAIKSRILQEDLHTFKFPLASNTELAYGFIF